MVPVEKNRVKVLLLEGVHEEAVEAFQQAGYTNVEHLKTALDGKELLDKMRGVHVLGIRSRTQVTEEVLAEAKDLIAIGNFCIGTNQVDLDVARRQGIPVFNAPFSNTRSVAELVVAETIMLFRDIPAKNATTHRGEWQKSAKDSFEVRGKNIGIVGYGNIGTQVSVLAEALGMNVFFFDIKPKLPIGNAHACRSLQELLRVAQVVTLHVPATPKTEWMIGEKEIELMKKGSYLINASRGNVVVIEALAAALKEGKIRGAAIDVFPKEPKSKDEEFMSELRAFDNVILTPHIGGSTAEAQKNIALEVSEKLIRYASFGDTSTSVNFPEVQLEENLNRTRFLHIHQNIPGVLESVNRVFASKGLNVSEQFLQTDRDVGYVVVGVDSKDIMEAQVIKELQEIKGTIKTRMVY